MDYRIKNACLRNELRKSKDEEEIKIIEKYDKIKNLVSTFVTDLSKLDIDIEYFDFVIDMLNDLKSVYDILKLTPNYNWKLTP